MHRYILCPIFSTIVKRNNSPSNSLMSDCSILHSYSIECYNNCGNLYNLPCFHFLLSNKDLFDGCLPFYTFTFEHRKYSVIRLKELNATQLLLIKEV